MFVQEVSELTSVKEPIDETAEVKKELNTLN